MHQPRFYYYINNTTNIYKLLDYILMLKIEIKHVHDCFEFYIYYYK